MHILSERFAPTAFVGTLAALIRVYVKAVPRIVQ